jgi:type VI secretion system secreted protein VgrG
MAGPNERLVDVVTPLGDKLWMRQMTGTEALSGLFEFDVTFHSTTLGIAAREMLGLPVTLKVETQDLAQRPFNGICTRFAAGGREGEHYLYTAKLRPWLWLASRRSDCKIFQRMTVPDIIEDVLKKYGFPLSRKLSKPYRTWDYCVQYQETDLNFVMRLMEHEGIYFFFEHAMGSHTLVLADDISAHAMMPERATILYSGIDAATVETEEHFDSWHLREEVDSGEYDSDDYDYKNPSGYLKTTKTNVMPHAQANKERYVWPGGYIDHGEGEVYAGVRMESLVAEHERAQGHCTLRTMAPGYRFNLKKCPQADQNREYLAVAATYFFRNNARMSAGSGAGDSTWGISVTSQPTTMAYRPQILTPKPLTSGPQTAVVVGPKGEEIYTDDEGYGRVKVQFFWDRYGKKDENSSCWIRVAHPWAGEKWGFIHIPRIGQEVVVDFIGGDPDYPLITGSVYNAEKMPPYALPANKTASGIKSRSTKGGSPTDFNEIRMEDLKGKEQLYMHAQRNLDTVVEADESRMVGHDRSTRIGHDDDRFVVNDDRHVIQNNQTNQIDGNQDTKVKKNQNNTVDGNQSNVVHGNRTQSVDGKLNEETGGDHFETVKGKHNFTVNGGENNMIMGDQTNMVTGDKTMIVTGDSSNTVTGKSALMSVQGYSVTTPMKYAETATQRSAMIYATDETTVLGMQTEKIAGMRDTTVGGIDKSTVGGAMTTTVGAAHSLTVGAASTVSAGGLISMTAGAAMTLTGGGVVSVTAGGAVTITAAGAITITAPVVMLATAAVLSSGVVVATGIVSPVYSPGLGNIL